MSYGHAWVPLYRRSGIVALALVDVEDLDELSRHRWYLNVDLGYAACPVAGQMHRFLMGDIGHLHVDHRNRVRLDNRRVNLRAVTPKVNASNRGRRPPLVLRHPLAPEPVDRFADGGPSPWTEYTI